MFGLKNILKTPDKCFEVLTKGQKGLNKFGHKSLWATYGKVSSILTTLLSFIIFWVSNYYRVIRMHFESKGESKSEMYFVIKAVESYILISTLR